MTTAYTPILKLALPVTGELNGTWGDVVNNNITSMVEQAVAGLATINTWTANSHTLTTADGTTSESRCAMLVIDDDGAGNPSAAATVICPTATKSYIVRNLCGQTVTVKTAAGTGVAIPNNQAALVFCDGTNVVTGAFNGDVVGPATSTNNAIVTFDGTTGKLIKDNSGATISAGVITATGVSTGQVDITAQGDLRLQDTTGGEYVALQAPGTLASSYTLTLPVDDGTAGQALITDGSGVLSWSTAASGDVYGPASATDNAVARFDSTTGKIIQNSAVTIGDDGATVIAANSSSDGLRITQVGTGNALLVEDSANPDSSPFVVTADGNVSIGTTTPTTTTYPLYIESLTGIVAIGGTNVAGTSPTIGVGKRRTGGSSVASGDSLGKYSGFGWDGASLVEAARMEVAVDGTPGTNDMPGRLVFSTTADGASSPTERMRITSSGAVGIGTALTQVNLYNTRNLSGNSTSYGNYLQATVQSDVTSAAHGYRSNLSTLAASFTLGALYGFYSGQGTFGAGSAVTNQYGFVADNTLTGATNNYGFYGNIASGTGRWNFYAAGTASNYFGGNTIVEVTDNTNAALRITQLGTGNALVVEDSANPDATPFVINNAGRVGIGTTPDIDTSVLQISTGGVTIAAFTNNAFVSAFINKKSRSTTVGSFTSVQNNDELGIYNFQGDDGTQFLRAAQISAFVDGTPGTNDMPGRLVFSTTADGASSPTERMRISSAGNVGIGTTTPGAKLAVVGTGYSPTITITDGATLNWDTSLGQVAQVTLGGNRTFAAPTNLVNGGFYSLLIIQDGTGSRTISWNAVFDFAGGTAPTLSTAAGAKDLITWRSDGTNMLEVGRSLGVA